MATPPNPTDGNPQNPVPEAVKPTTNDQQDADKGASKEPSIFVNTEPIREDQVQNAVKFLSHPKVKGSPVMYRRSFLERKGLTKEEIDESFRRVPDESPSLSTTQPQPAVVSTSQPTSNVQPQAAQAPVQSIQSVTSPSSKLGTRFHWSHALLAVGVLAVSGAGTAVVFKNAVVPRLKSWIRKVVDEDKKEDVGDDTDKKPTLAEEAAAAAKAAAGAASDVARASQEMLASKTEEKKHFGELLSLLDVQVQEMKSMSNSIRKLEGQSNISGREVQVTTNSRAGYPPYTNGRADYDSRSARSLSPPPASVEPPPSATPSHPKSYMEIMNMIQRGERPPNIREINDLPPNPDQPVSNPRLAPKPKPWEAAQSQGGPIYENTNGLQDTNGAGPASAYETSAPWWQQKNVRISEVEGEENKTTSYYNGGTSSTTEQRPVQRSSWVPPQPPPVAMAEAAAAIRQPKKTPFEKEQQLTDDQFLARSSEVTDELQRVTKMAESGGNVVVDGGGAGGDGSSVVMDTSEIQREEEGLYYEA